MALLKTLNGNPQQATQPHPQQQATSQAPQTEIEKIFAQFSGSQRQPPPQPQTQIQQPASVAPGFDLQSALAALSHSNHGQQQLPPQVQIPQVQALLAQMGQQQSAQSRAYGYPNPYQGDYDRKRSRAGWGDTDGPSDYDDRGVGDFGYANSSNTKRQKAAMQVWLTKKRSDCVRAMLIANPVADGPQNSLQILERWEMQEGQ